MFKISAKELAALFDQTINSANLIENISTNSKNIGKNTLFVPIIGNNFDGHAFISEAFDNGAVFSLSSDKSIIDERVIYVKDTLDALKKIAIFNRSKFHGKMLALTGSSGKTTTKEMISCILSASDVNFLVTRANLNNNLGVTFTLNELHERHDIAIVEMGANSLGEIAYSVDITKPQIAAITNIGNAHLGKFGSFDNLLAAKSEIICNLASDEVAVLNIDDACFTEITKLTRGKIYTFGMNNQANCYAYDVNITDHHMSFNVSLFDNQLFLSVGFTGEHYIYDMLCAMLCTYLLGVDVQYCHALNNFKLLNGRGKNYQLTNELLLIDDSYNANVESFKAAINVLMLKKLKRILIFGEMAELGTFAETLHREVALYANDKIDELWSFGTQAENASIYFCGVKKSFSSIEDIFLALQKQARAVVLVKGSHSTGLYKLIEKLPLH